MTKSAYGGGAWVNREYFCGYWSFNLKKDLSTMMRDHIVHVPVEMGHHHHTAYIFETNRMWSYLLDSNVSRTKTYQLPTQWFHSNFWREIRLCAIIDTPSVHLNRPPPEYSLLLKLELKLKLCYPHESVDETLKTVSLDLDSVGEESFQRGFMNLYTSFEHCINFREDYLKD